MGFPSPKRPTNRIHEGEVAFGAGEKHEPPVARPVRDVRAEFGQPQLERILPRSHRHVRCDDLLGDLSCALHRAFLGLEEARFGRKHELFARHIQL